MLWTCQCCGNEYDTRDKKEPKWNKSPKHLLAEIRLLEQENSRLKKKLLGKNSRRSRV